MSYYLNKLADWADDTFYPGWNRPRGDLNVYGSQASDYTSNSNSNSNLIQNVKRFFGCDKDGCRYHYEMGKRKSSKKKSKTAKKSMKKKTAKKSMKKKTAKKSMKKKTAKKSMKKKTRK